MIDQRRVEKIEDELTGRAWAGVEKFREETLKYVDAGYHREVEYVGRMIYGPGFRVRRPEAARRAAD